MDVSGAVSNFSVGSWDQLLNMVTGYGPGWAFRGMADTGWALETSLDRLRTQLQVQAEHYLLSTFQRRAHHYIADPPRLEDTLEWLALMQHHGAPTRLLDWTKSPYVAIFFAMSSGGDSGEAALWAIDLEWCKREALQRLQVSADPGESLGKPEVFSTAFLSSSGLTTSNTLVAPMQPFRMNQRLTIQQGLFLCPGNVGVSFEQNLLAFQGSGFSGSVHKIVIPRWLRIECLRALNKMNINQGTLFPGLDGFAQSLGLNVQIATATGRLSAEQQKLSIWTEYGNI